MPRLPGLCCNRISAEVYELDGAGRYARAASAGEGVLEQVPGCVGERLDLDALWRELDALANAPMEE